MLVVEQLTGFYGFILIIFKFDFDIAFFCIYIISASNLVSVHSLIVMLTVKKPVLCIVVQGDILKDLFVIHFQDEIVMMHEINDEWEHAPVENKFRIISFHQANSF